MRRALTLIVSIVLISCFVNAQTPKTGSTITTFGHSEDIDSTKLYGILHHNAPEDFRNPGVPAVAVVGKGGKFVLGVGGFIKVVTGFDIGHPIEDPDQFITSQIPMEPKDGDGMRYNLSAQQTRLFINFVALPGTGNEIGAFISANLMNGYAPMIEYGYLKYKGLKAGYDNTLFSDPSCGAPEVDYEGPCSNTANPVGGISYSWEPNPHGRWMYGIGIELPQVSFTTVENRTKQVYQRVPDIPIAGKFSWDDENSWVRVSTILRTLTYRDLETRKNHNKFAYGFQLSGGWNFLEKLTLYYQGVWGKGICSLLEDTAGEGLDLSPVDDGTALNPVMAWGGFASILYEINDRFSASTTFSQVRTYVPGYEGGTTEWADQYKYAQYVSTNVFCNITDYFQVGLEHIWGRRVNYDGMKCNDNRLQLAFQLSF